MICGASHGVNVEQLNPLVRKEAAGQREAKIQFQRSSKSTDMCPLTPDVTGHHQPHQQKKICHHHLHLHATRTCFLPDIWLVSRHGREAAPDELSLTISSGEALL